MDIGGALRRTRKSVGLTQTEVADRAGISRQAVVLLERGGGSMSTLAKVAPQVGLRIIGIARGDVLHEQVKRARRQRKLTQQRLAERAGVSLPTIRAVEAGLASITSLSAILQVLAPNAREAPLAGCGKRHVKARHWSRFHRFQTMPTVILAGTLPKAGRVWPFWAL